MGKVRASRGRHSLISRFLNLRLIILLVLGCVHAGCETLPPIVPSREPILRTHGLVLRQGWQDYPCYRSRMPPQSG
jgi:hypothetical protein